jgi:hypothetical protein
MPSLTFNPLCLLRRVMCWPFLLWGCQHWAVNLMSSTEEHCDVRSQRYPLFSCHWLASGVHTSFFYWRFSKPFNRIIVSFEDLTVEDSGLIAEHTQAPRSAVQLTDSKLRFHIWAVWNVTLRMNYKCKRGSVKSCHVSYLWRCEVALRDEPCHTHTHNLTLSLTHTHYHTMSHTVPHSHKIVTCCVTRR